MQTELQKRRIITARRTSVSAGLSLRMRRIWFAEDGGQPTPSPASPDGAQNTDDKEERVPYSRFQEVNSKFREAEAELNRLRTADEERKRAEALARGDHEKVINELKPKAERADRLESTLKVYLEAELESIPEQFRDLVPDGDLDTKLRWIANAKKRGMFNAPQAPDLDPGKTGDRPDLTKLTPEELSIAAKMGVSPEKYAANKKA